ncbi:hypothetical protein HAX54_039301 [Datura stramonium]|uniref:Uncharacterized protein n=1 Tax=Datura stramonium TaxID=4076 RepID=A0ABS8VL25_DATST|nr:hypothetical protein [Datura stramonium]
MSYLKTVPSMAPNDFFPQKDDPIVLSTEDHSFAVSGEIMLLVLVLLFTLFLVTLIFFFCMKHYSRFSSTPPDQIVVQSPYPSIPMSIKPLHRNIPEFDGARWTP